MKIIFDKLIDDISAVVTNGEFELCAGTALNMIKNLDPTETEKLFFVFKERVKFFVVEKGILPPFSLLEFFYVFENHLKNSEKDKALESQIIGLKEHFSGIPMASYEYFLFNNLIFLLKIFNGEFESGFSHYLGNVIKSNIFEAYKYPEAYQQFANLLKKSLMPVDMIVKHLIMVLDEELFFNNDVESQNSILLWIMTVIWAEERFIGSSVFYELSKPFEKIMLKALNCNNLALAMQTYKVAHDILGNLFQTQEKMAWFNQVFTQPVSLHYSQIGKSLPSLIEVKKSKKKIAFVRDRFVNNSPHMIEYSVIKMLMSNANFKENFDVYIYSLGRIEKDLDDEKIIAAYQRLGVIVKAIPKMWYERGYYYNPVEKVMMIRNDIIQENIDVLIGTVAANSDLDFLFGTRSAPLQVYWSHGNFEYDVENIDKRITHCNVPEGKFQFSHFTVERDYSDYRQDDMIQEAQRIKDGYPKDTVILGSIGRLVKVDSMDYLTCVATLLKTNPNTVYLACGVGNEESIKEKVEALGIGDKFIFVGFVDAKIYVHVLDIYLDTFPHHGGESIREAQRAGCSVAILHVESEKGVPDPVSVSTDEILKKVNYRFELLDNEWLENEGFIHQAISFASLNSDAYIGIVDYFIKHPESRSLVKRVFENYTPERISSNLFLEAIGCE
ncbi:MAG: glycosyltransferase [Sulfuricurvum sp.]|nr:glycosyltransferase [Sulfuricurvum sp.]